MSDLLRHDIAYLRAMAETQAKKTGRMGISDGRPQSTWAWAAADRIEALTAERDRLREALRAIEDMATEFHTAEMRPVADRARAALAAKEPRDE